MNLTISALVDTLNRQKFRLEWLAKRLNIQTYTDWYNVSVHDINKLSGPPLLELYKIFRENAGGSTNSLAKTLPIVYPQYQWHSFSFDFSPSDILKGKSHREVHDWIANHFNVHTQSDWYSIKIGDVHNLVGTDFLDPYSNSLSNSLSTVYPEFEWVPFLFERVPNHFWKTNGSKRAYLDWLFDELGFSTQQDWYSTNLEHFTRHKGRSLFNSTTPSHIDLLRSVYPEFTWHVWKFPQVTEGFWNNPSNHKEYLDYLSELLQIDTQEDWYSVTVNDFPKSILSMYRGNVYSIVSSVYPQFEWFAWKFSQVPDGYWNDMKSQRNLFEWVGNQLGIEQLDDWYRVTLKDFTKVSSTGILRVLYNNSLQEALKNVYPEHKWIPWRFAGVRHGYWREENSIRDFLTWIKEHFSLRNEDWKSAPVRDVMLLGGSSVIRQKGGLSKIVAAYSADEDITQLFSRGKTQKRLIGTLQSIFNSKKHHYSKIQSRRQPATESNYQPTIA